MILIDGECKAFALDASAVLLVKVEGIKREAGPADRVVTYRTRPFRWGGGDYHRTKPFCQDSSRSRTRNSSVISPEHKRAMINSAAYMLA